MGPGEEPDIVRLETEMNDGLRMEILHGAAERRKHAQNLPGISPGRHLQQILPAHEFFDYERHIRLFTHAEIHHPDQVRMP